MSNTPDDAEDFLDALDAIFTKTRRGDVGNVLDREMEIALHQPPPHVEGSPCIKVLRLEKRSDPKVGAFASKSFWNNDDALIWPAEKWAENHGVKPPSHLPNMMKDGPDIGKRWTRQHYAGWLDLNQMDMWLPVPEMRAAVYDANPEACVREYLVAKDRVLFGEHQIGFMLDFAVAQRHLTREEFVREDRNPVPAAPTRRMFGTNRTD